jgi:hypothetical protein
MSARITGWVLEHSPEKLGRRLVLLAIADAADHDGHNAYESVPTLAKKARLSVRQTQNCLRELEKAGAIRKDGISSYGTAVYSVVTEGVQILHQGEIYDTNGSKTAPDPKNVLVVRSLRELSTRTALRARPKRTEHEQQRFDALYDEAKVLGLEPPIAKAARTAYMDIVWDLVGAEVTPEQMRRGAGGFKREWPEMTLTMAALGKWLPTFAATPQEKAAAARRRQEEERERRWKEAEGG